MNLLIPDRRWLEALCPPGKLGRFLDILSRAFWPGPLTLLLPAARHLPGHLSGEEGMVAVRISSEPFVQALMETHQRPITSTSANPADRKPATTISELKDYFGTSSEEITLAVDGGIRRGLPSTIARIRDDEVSVLREGSITRQDILAACPS